MLKEQSKGGSKSAKNDSFNLWLSALNVSDDTPSLHSLNVLSTLRGCMVGGGTGERLYCYCVVVQVNGSIAIVGGTGERLYWYCVAKGLLDSLVFC